MGAHPHVASMEPGFLKPGNQAKRSVDTLAAIALQWSQAS